MHADGAPSDSIGQRIARARKRRALTQHGLADRSNYSRSHIAQVEAGHKVATPAFIAAAAAALAVDPAELYGQPFRGDTAREDRVHAAIPEIRRALAYVDVAPDLDAPPRSLDDLTAALATAHRLQRDARHTQLGARLPAVLEELTFHAYETEDSRTWSLLNRAHAVAVSLTRRLGYNDLANQILERAAVSAARSQDPHLPLLVAMPRALLMMNVAAWGPALKLLQRAADAVDHDRADAAEVFGALRMRAAIVSARAGEKNQAWDYYREAVETSERSGRANLDRHGTNFVPGNIAIHGAAVAVELKDFDEAVRREPKAEVMAALNRERRAHHLVDMARVHVEINDRERALSRLLTAEKTAPQMTRYHPMARAVAAHLGNAYRDLPETLRGLLSRMHV